MGTTDTARKVGKEVAGRYEKVAGRYEKVAGYHLENQIKNILAMGGGSARSVKGFKAVFATLQSRAPKEFPLEWDVLFFSIYSRKLISELSFLILEKGEVEEVLWRQKGSCHPFHHIYILTKKARRSITSPFYKNYEKPYYSDFIVWSLLQPKFSIYWSYFLEMYTFQEMSPEKKNLPFLPLLEHEAEGDQKTHLIKQRDDLCQRLRELRISSLSAISPSYAGENNLYIFLPFQMKNTTREKFFNFYKSGQHNKYVDIQESQRRGEHNLFDVRINPEGIANIYSYIELTRKEIKEEQLRFNKVQQFEELVDYYTLRMRGEVPEDNEDGSLAYYRIKEAAQDKREFLNNIPNDLKQRVIERGKELLLTLEKFHELAQWRYDDIISKLVKLASVSQRIPLNLFFDSVDLKGYLNNICVDGQTMIGFEFSGKFRACYEKEFRYKMPSDSLHHVYHFVQPGEVLKAIYNRKENCLLDGGPVVGEY